MELRAEQAVHPNYLRSSPTSPSFRHSQTMLASVVRSEDQVKTLRESLQATPASQLTRKSSEALPLNVIMFGTDSMSRNAWRRYMPMTYNFFVDTLKGSVLEGYNIVGDGTPQALLPILTGEICSRDEDKESTLLLSTIHAIHKRNLHSAYSRFSFSSSFSSSSSS